MVKYQVKMFIVLEIFLDRWIVYLRLDDTHPHPLLIVLQKKTLRFISHVFLNPHPSPLFLSLSPSPSHIPQPARNMTTSPRTCGKVEGSGAASKLHEPSWLECGLSDFMFKILEGKNYMKLQEPRKFWTSSSRFCKEKIT